MLDRHALNYVNGMEQEALELLKELAQPLIPVRNFLDNCPQPVYLIFNILFN